MVAFNLLLFLLRLFQLQLLAKISMYYILLFHLLLTLLFFDMLLLSFLLLLQKFRLTHLFYILMYLNHLAQCIHNCLYFLFLKLEILLMNMLVFQIFCQNAPMMVLMILVQRMSILLNYLHYSIKFSYRYLLNFDLHQMQLPHNVVIMQYG